MSRRFHPLALFVLALTVRLVAAWVLGIGGGPLEDERGYLELAETLAAGEGLHLSVPAEVLADASVSGVPALTSFRAPLWPAFLAPLAAVGAEPWAMRLVAVVLGALGAPLLYLCVREGSLSRFALLPAVGYALWPPHVYLSTRALSEPLCQVLLLAAVWALLRLGPSQDGRPVGRPGWAGVLAGLAVLAKPAALLPCGFLAVAAGSRSRAATFLLMLAVTLAPWVARNVFHHGRPLLTTNSGVTLVGGNCSAAARAEHPGKWLHPSRVYAEAVDPPDLAMWGWSRLGEEAGDRRFVSDAVSWWISDPVGAVRLAGWKIVRLFDPDPHSAKKDAGRKRLAGWLTLPVVLLLAVLGAGRVRSRWRELGPWVLLLAGTVATAVVFYGDSRMRTTADPSLLVLAAVGWSVVRARIGDSPVTE